MQKIEESLQPLKYKFAQDLIDNLSQLKLEGKDITDESKLSAARYGFQATLNKLFLFVHRFLVLAKKVYSRKFMLNGASRPTY